MDHIQAFLEKFPGKTVHPEIERLVKIVETNPRMRDTDRVTLIERIVKFYEKYDKMLELMDDVRIGRAWTDIAIGMGKENGIKEYMSVAEFDERICLVCLKLHGQIFPIEGALEEGEAEERPFPEYENISGLAPEKISMMKLRPPYHPGCRCNIVVLW